MTILKLLELNRFIAIKLPRIFSTAALSGKAGLGCYSISNKHVIFFDYPVDD